MYPLGCSDPKVNSSSFSSTFQGIEPKVPWVVSLTCQLMCYFGIDTSYG